MDPEADTIVRRRLEDWRRRLIDLSYRNRLIKYRATTATTLEFESPAIDVVLADIGRATPWRFYFPPDEGEQGDPEFGDAKAAEYVDHVVVQGAQHGATPPRSDEIVVRGGLTARQINRILENLARKSNSEFQDKALRILYIAAGFLDWIDPARDEVLSSPLVLVPVELRRETARHPYALYFVDDEEITINPSLTEKLRRDLNLDLPGDWVWEDKSVSEELDEIEQAIDKTDWEVRRDAALGLFSFQKFVMYRDLLDNESQIVEHSVIRSLAGGSVASEPQGTEQELPRLEELDDVQPAETDYSILDADATQRLCLEAARRGHSFVMQGPPGTGKSQTIANVIADAIGRGKRILFVSEKAAALDVVHKRLAAQGLDEFCLLLHGEHAARREVVEALNHSLMGELVPRTGLTSHDFERLTHLRELLNSTAQLVHLPMKQLGDRSLREVLGELAQLHAAPSVPAAPEPSTSQGADIRLEFQQLDEIFQRLTERWHVSPKQFAWKEYAGERFTADDHGRVLAVVRAAQVAVLGLRDASSDVARLVGWSEPINGRAVDSLLELGRHVETAPSLAQEWLVPGTARKFRDALEAAQKAFEKLAQRRTEFADAYPHRSLDTFLPGSPDEMEARCRELADVAGRTPAWEQQLLPSLQPLGPFLSRARDVLDEIESAAAEARDLLGQPADRLTLERAQAIARLAILAFRGEDRPERDWLVRAGLERAQQALAENRATIGRYQSELGKQLEQYEETVVHIDAAGLLARFTTEHTGALSKLRGSYRRDVKAIKAVRQDRTLPIKLRKELKKLVEIQSLGRQIDGASDRFERAFGSYFRGRDTDLGRIERALRMASEVLNLIAPRSDLAKLGDQIAAGSSPDAEIAQFADRLESAMHELASGLDSLRPLIGKADALSPEASLDVLRAQLERLAGPLDAFAGTYNQFAHGSRDAVTDLSTLVARCQVVRDLHSLTGAIERHESAWRSVLMHHYRRDASGWDEASRVAAWLEQFEQLVKGKVPPLLERSLLGGKAQWPDFTRLEVARTEQRTSLRVFSSLFEQGRREKLERLSEQEEFSEVEVLFSELILSVDDLHDWTEFRTSRNQVRKRGWGSFLDALAENGVEGPEVVAAFRRAYWTRRLEALFEEERDLADRGTTYSRWIAEFRELDQRLVRTAADRVIASRNRIRRPTVVTRGSQVELLRREAAKRRRHRPVRKLLAEISNLLSELKPCLMMSPLTVSHFLAPTHQFDLVIFDEASQVPPQDAINCIYRATQLIVAGDSRQLPPTPFFQVAEPDEGWDESTEDSKEDMESILDSCESLLPQHPLRWHYRSRHESLIAFSNEHIYNGALLTFPSADVVSSAKGVTFVHVPDGLYDRGRSGTNRREARVVAERVVGHLREGRHSVGVIAFNVSQAGAIAEELDRMRIEHPDLEEHFAGDRLDAVFVKHLESVQGDERDVIVFSIGYGRDTAGKFTMNFGPLNKDGGHRRLNVAVTRARELVEVVSSVRAADFSLGESASRGARLLQEYLRYAEVQETITADRTEESHFESPLETTIAAAITALGYTAAPQVGVGSLRIAIGARSPTHSDRFAIGIETDGDSYRSAPTARDRDRLREEILTQLGWKIHRIWSIDWVRNRQGEIERLRKALEESNESRLGALEEGDKAGLPTSSGSHSELADRDRAERVVEDLQHALDYGRLPWVAEYQRAKLPYQATHYEFHESVNRDRQVALLIELLQTEAPIHADYALRRLARAWGLERVGPRVRNAGMQAIKMAVRKNAAELRGPFLWLPGQEITAVRSPKPADPSTCRSIGEIPPEEIDLAIGELLGATGGVAHSSLISEVAKVLGFDRVGGKIRDVLNERLPIVAFDKGIQQ